MAAEPQIFAFRNIAREISPWWLRRGIALRLIYAIALHLDVILQMAVEAVRRRYPGLDSNDSLPLIGSERRITRGRNEIDATYAARMRRWIDDHRLRGGPYAMLRQLRAHFAAAPFRIRLRYYSGRQFEMAALDGAITRSDVVWLPDAANNRWARWWLFYDWPDPVVDEGAWGDPGDWGDGGTWGTSLTVDEVEDVRIVPRQWNAGHIIKGRIVLAEGTTELWGDPGDWGDPGWWGPEGYAAIDVQ
jgi:hypothetical protein